MLIFGRNLSDKNKASIWQVCSSMVSERIVRQESGSKIVFKEREELEPRYSYRELE